MFRLPLREKKPGRPCGKVDYVLQTLRRLNDPDFQLAQMARVVIERERYFHGRRIGLDEALAEAQVWFRRRFPNGIRRVKIEARANAFGFTVRKPRRPQPIRRPNVAKARELLRSGRTWWD